MVGRRVRRARAARRWTIRDLAERSGLSIRFLVQVEAGTGNISVRRLDDLARALQMAPADLLTEHDGAGPHIVALLGLRGAGKTTIGRQLARRLRVRFVELDRRVEQMAEMSLAQIFSLYGEEHYRRLEREALRHVIQDNRAVVLATGGGIVAAPDTFALLRASATTVWLRASPEDHWSRVVGQGDRRPMADHPQAMADLRAILAQREPLYAGADYTIETTGRDPAAIVEELAAAL